MAEMTLNITGDQAERQVQGHLRRERTARRMPPIPDMLKRIAQETRVYIFNVGPWQLTSELGSLGRFTIPACPADKEYISMDPIPGIVFEPVVQDEGNFRHVQEEGQYIAEQILGIGKMLPPSQSYIHLGCFISKTPVPSKQAVADAKEALRATYERFVTEARRAFDQGPKEAEAVITDRHRQAARSLNLMDEAWYKQITPESRVKCPACTTTLDAAAILCSNCKFVLKPAEYEKMKARFAS